MALNTSISRVFPLPQVTTVFDDGEGTMAHPLPADEYLYPPTRPRANGNNSWTRDLEDRINKEPSKSVCCRSWWLILLSSLVLASLSLFAGIVIGSQIIDWSDETCSKHSARRQLARHMPSNESDLEESEVTCPFGSDFAEISEQQYSHKKERWPIAAKTAFDCKQLCGVRPTCVGAFYDPMNRDCHLWMEDICQANLLESRDNSKDFVTENCVKWSCIHYKKICLCPKKKQTVFLADLWFYKSCVRVANYRDVEMEIC